MKPLAILGASIGGLVGAVGIGLIAGGPGGARAIWMFALLGGLIGGGCYLLGGRGAKAELLCLLITAESIVVGYLFAGWVQLHTDMVPMEDAKVQGVVERQYSEDTYIEILRAIDDYKALNSRQVDDAFLLSWRLRDPSSPGQVTDDEREYFERHWKPKLQQWAVSGTNPTEAKAAWVAARAHFAWHNRKYSESFVSVAWDNLGLFDFIFVAIALVAGPGLIGYLSDRERTRKEREAHFARKGLVEFKGKQRPADGPNSQAYARKSR